ncbi:MAG: thiol:disulfide interchange protein DsbA/DsbL [Methylophilaceae bacterium]|jgi:protein dithiol oxidoreductase (disulfide-forming)|nr:thiol:disulfide interchange protein DsbA/DsbL [Methylophilaceae bacterium]
MKKLLLALFVIIANTGVGIAVEPKPGVNFKATNEVISTDSGNKIEVVELFWYGCIHCYTLDPYIDKWADTLPKDVVFKRIPAIPRKNWSPGAKAYYALETLDLDHKLHEKLFEAIHKEKTLNPVDEKNLIKWIATNGKLDTAEVNSAFNSFSMNAKLSRSFKMFKSAGATGVPSIIIDGRYLTSSTMAGGEQNTIDLMNYIIDNIRKEKTK